MHNGGLQCRADFLARSGSTLPCSLRPDTSTGAVVYSAPGATTGSWCVHPTITEFPSSDAITSKFHDRFASSIPWLGTILSAHGEIDAVRATLRLHVPDSYPTSDVDGHATAAGHSNVTSVRCSCSSRCGDAAGKRYIGSPTAAFAAGSHSTMSAPVIGPGFLLDPMRALVIQEAVSANFIAVPSVGPGVTRRPFLSMYEHRTSEAAPFFCSFHETWDRSTAFR